MRDKTELQKLGFYKDSTTQTYLLKPHYETLNAIMKQHKRPRVESTKK